MFVAMTAFDLLGKRQFPREPIDYVVVIVINLLIWPFAGYCFGLLMWGFYEKRFSDTSSEL